MGKKQENEKREFLVYFTIADSDLKGNVEVSANKMNLEVIHQIKEGIAKQCKVSNNSAVIQNIMELK